MSVFRVLFVTNLRLNEARAGCCRQATNVVARSVGFSDPAIIQEFRRRLGMSRQDYEPKIRVASGRLLPETGETGFAPTANVASTRGRRSSDPSCITVIPTVHPSPILDKQVAGAL